METTLRVGDPARIGPYQVAGRLGSGGMGVVYLATGTRGAVALKLVRPEFSDDDEFRARFRREVQSSFRVQSMSVVRLVDFDTEDERPWMAMEFVDGESLAERVGSGGTVSAPAQKALAIGLADALLAIHAQGLVHRDLKPDNVLCPIQGPKVIDLGIAAAVDGSRITSAGALVGAPGYWSPEQIQTGVATPASDVFAWGCTLVFAASGEAPFGTGPAEVMLYRVLHGAEVVDLSRLAPELQPLVAAALRRDPAERPTAEQLLCTLLGESSLPGDAQRRIRLTELFLRDWRGWATERFTPTQFAALIPAQPDYELSVVPGPPVPRAPEQGLPSHPEGAPWAAPTTATPIPPGPRPAPDVSGVPPATTPKLRPRRRGLVASLVAGLVVLAVVVAGVVFLPSSESSSPGQVANVRASKLPEAVELTWTPVAGASRFQIARDGQPVAEVNGVGRHVVPLPGDLATHEFTVATLDEKGAVAFVSGPVKGTAYGPWGPAQPLAASFPELVPPSPSAPSSAGQRCVGTGTGAEPSALAAITCTYPDGAVLELLRYRDIADQRARLAELERTGKLWSWLHENQVPGGVYVGGADATGPWEHRTFYNRPTMALRSAWPGHSEKDLRDRLGELVD